MDTMISANFRSGSGESLISKRIRYWGDPFHVVEDVVEVGGDAADVLAIERRDEGRVEGVEDVARDDVPVVLEGLELRHLGLPVVQARALRDLEEEPGRAQKVLGILVEELVEPLLLGHEELDDLVASHANLLSTLDCDDGSTAV
jgi:hypothetical protein